ncbi:MAG: HEPN domain-containing protein [Syntrophales bacterium]
MNVIEFLETQLGRLNENLLRAENLVNLYKSIHKVTDGEQAEGNTNIETDILRSAIVFIHASLEDFLRSISSAHLPRASEEALNKIPLSGKERKHDRIYLGELTRFRGMTINDVIQDSVDKYLEQSNYNNTDEIAKLLQNLGIKPNEINENFDILQQMMKRRHRIVHRADRLDANTSGRLEEIKDETIKQWIDITRDFGEKVLKKLLLNDALKELQMDMA